MYIGKRTESISLWINIFWLSNFCRSFSNFNLMEWNYIYIKFWIYYYLNMEKFCHLDIYISIRWYSEKALAFILSSVLAKNMQNHPTQFNLSGILLVELYKNCQIKTSHSLHIILIYLLSYSMTILDNFLSHPILSHPIPS